MADLITLNFKCCGIKMEAVMYSYNSWHCSCRSCGRIFRIEEITNLVRDVEKRAKQKVKGN